MIWKETFLVVWACVLLLSACSSPRDIIFDADIGSSTDDLMALQLLLRRHDAGECRLSGVVVDRMGDSCVMVADVMDTYYGHPCVPLGTERDGVRLSKVFTPYTFILNDTTDEGKPLFAQTIKDCSELPDGWVLYRRLLSQADDHSVDIVATGFVTSLAHLLLSPADSISPYSGIELVRRKVGTLYLMGTKLGEDNGLGYNLKYDTLAVQELFRLWPSEVGIRISPSIVGDAIRYDPSLVVQDYSPQSPHPILQTYRTTSIHDGQRMWDVLPVIHALKGDRWFRLSRCGTVRVSDSGEVVFESKRGGNCRYQKPFRHQRKIRSVLKMIRPE